MEKQYLTAGVFLGFLLILSNTGSVAAQTSQLAYGLDEAQPRELTTSEKIKASRLHIQLEGNPVDAAYNYANKEFIGTNNEIRIEKVQKDNLKYTHIRMKQYFKGIPIDGSDIIMHVNGRNILYKVDGATINDIAVDVKPSLQQIEAERIALDDVSKIKCLDKECQQVAPIDSLGPELRDQILKSNEQQNVAMTKMLPFIIYGSSGLAYRLIVSVRGIDYADWEYWIDAQTGEIVRRYNTIQYSYGTKPPSENGYDTLVTGCQLAREVKAGADSFVTMTGWKDTGATTNHRYFLTYKGNPDSAKASWKIFNMHYNDLLSDTLTDSLCRWEQLGSYNWSTLDRHCISVAKNSDLVLKWLKDTLGLYSFDDSGHPIEARVHYKQYFANAGWNTEEHFLLIGDGDAGNGAPPDTTSEFGVLDVIGHEIGHAVTQFSSGINFSQLETGAINESFSDIMGVSIEFAFQQDSSSAYPRRVKGCADWYASEDVAIIYQAFRDFSYGFRTQDLDSIPQGRATYYDGDYYWPDTAYGGKYYCFDSTEWKGKYDKLAVQNFAFYLLAQGNPDSLRVPLNIPDICQVVPYII